MYASLPRGRGRPCFICVLASATALALGQAGTARAAPPTPHDPGPQRVVSRITGLRAAGVGSTLTLHGTTSETFPDGRARVEGSYDGRVWHRLAVTRVMRNGAWSVRIELVRRGLLHLRVELSPHMRAVGSIRVR